MRPHVDDRTLDTAHPLSAPLPAGVRGPVAWRAVRPAPRAGVPGRRREGPAAASPGGGAT
jgi:hypothetical protein